MRNTCTISLNRTQWEAFERKLNTIDMAREHRAQAFLHEMDEIVTVVRSNTNTEIDLPWLDDADLLALLTGTQEQRVSQTVTVNGNDGGMGSSGAYHVAAVRDRDGFDNRERTSTANEAIQEQVIAQSNCVIEGHPSNSYSLAMKQEALLAA